MSYDILTGVRALVPLSSRVFIFDENEEKRLPMFDFWHRLSLAKLVSVGDLTAANQSDKMGIALPTSQEEWRKRGTFFSSSVFYNSATHSPCLL